MDTEICKGLAEMCNRADCPLADGESCPFSDREEIECEDVMWTDWDALSDAEIRVHLT